MKHLWLILCAVTLLLSSCVVGPDSFALVPTPDYSGYADMIKEYDSAGSSQELIEDPGGRVITVISMGDLAADSWLLGWAIEAALNDMPEIAGEGSPDDDGIALFVWLYANGFAASELRCAEGRSELGDLIETFAAKVGKKRPDTSLHHMIVANTLWKQLPEGAANCSAYLADLPDEEFMKDTRIPGYALLDHYSREDVTVITPNLMKADAWLHGWAKEAVTRDSVESHSDWPGDWLEKTDWPGDWLEKTDWPGDWLEKTDWPGDWLEKIEWMYANGFVASERRCAEGREELAGLIEAYAAILRSKRSEEIFHSRMSVAHTLWQTLPEGDNDCTAYLSDLAVEAFMPLLVENTVYYGFGL